MNESKWSHLVTDYVSWLEGVRNLSPHTLRAYHGDLEAFGTWCAREGIDPLSASNRQVRGYLSYLVRGSYAEKTINRKLSALRRFYDWLEREGHVEVSAFASIPGRKLRKTLPRTMTDADLESLLRSCDKETPEGLRDAAFIELLYATGARISEVAHLAVADVDFAEQQVRLFGKGRKERCVPVYQEALDTLADYITRARPVFVAKRRADGTLDALFVSTRGNSMSADALRHRFKLRVVAAGLDNDVIPHAVRHTYATELLSGGADLKTVQELLGHESLATTQIYTHLSVERLKQATRQAHPRASVS